MFRTLRPYRITSPWPATEAALDERLSAVAFEPCPALREHSSGWEPPTGQEGMSLARRVHGADLLRLRTQSRVLPAAAVNEALEERLAAFEARTGAPPSRREKRELKEEVHASLLPQALLKSTRTAAYYQLDEALLVVDAATDTEAERFLDVLRGALGSLEAVPLSFKRPMGGFLTEVFLGQAPGTFESGRECRMADPSHSGAYVQWMDVDLGDASIRRHVRDGFSIERLALTYDHVIGGVLDGEGVLRKVRLLGMDAADVADNEDPLLRLDAEFTLLTATGRRLFAALKKHLGGVG